MKIKARFLNLMFFALLFVSFSLFAQEKPDDQEKNKAQNKTKIEEKNKVQEQNKLKEASKLKEKNQVKQFDQNQEGEKPINKNGNEPKKHGLGFVDEDGDGFNDNAPDDDGDGIPNGLDPDYMGGQNRKGFIDLDGDGINDNARRGKAKGKMGRYGFYHGFGNQEATGKFGHNTGEDNSVNGMRMKGKGKGGN